MKMIIMMTIIKKKIMMKMMASNERTMSIMGHQNEVEALIPC